MAWLMKDKSLRDKPPKVFSSRHDKWKIKEREISARKWIVDVMANERKAATCIRSPKVDLYCHGEWKKNSQELSPRRWTLDAIANKRIKRKRQIPESTLWIAWRMKVKFARDKSPKVVCAFHEKWKIKAQRFNSPNLDCFFIKLNEN